MIYFLAIVVVETAIAVSDDILVVRTVFIDGANFDVVVPIIIIVVVVAAAVVVVKQKSDG